MIVVGQRMESESGSGPRRGEGVRYGLALLPAWINYQKASRVRCISRGVVEESR